MRLTQFHLKYIYIHDTSTDLPGNAGQKHETELPGNAGQRGLGGQGASPPTQLVVIVGIVRSPSLPNTSRGVVLICGNGTFLVFKQLLPSKVFGSLGKT